MSTFKPRTTRPEAGNKYYITKGRGGYSDAMQGKPTDPSCDVLSNCVGYAFGRFNEIGGYGYCKYLRPVNAERFIQYRGNLAVGQTPKIGACMVWRKGATLGGGDGAGHVAIVERVIGPTQVVTSESGYGSATPFWTKTRNKGSGDWGAGAGYTFLGFIYNPAPCCQDGGGSTAAPSTGSSTPSPSAGVNATGTVYVVQSGDTLAKIAAKYGTTYKILAEYNCITNPHLIYVGQRISIPSAGEAPSKPEETGTSTGTQDGGTTYTVKVGDTLWQIACRLLDDGSRYPEIMQLNGLTSTIIQIGAVLKIPEK